VGHGGADGPRRHLAQSAQGGDAHRLQHIVDLGQGGAVGARKARQQLDEALGALAAWRALATRLLGVVGGEPARHLEGGGEGGARGDAGEDPLLAGQAAVAWIPGTLIEKLREEMKFLRDGLSVRAIIESEPEELTLPPEIEEETYYVLREGLMNITRHAQASQVQLQLQEVGGRIQGMLADDGVGFEPESVTGRNGYGLITMEERIKKLGGTLTINSSPGHGTRISFSAPLKSLGA